MPGDLVDQGPDLGDHLDPLGDADGAPGVEQVEVVGALQAHVVGRQEQVFRDQPGGLLLAGPEGLAEHGDGGGREVVFRELLLLAEAEVAVADVGGPVEVVDVVLLFEEHLQPFEAVGDLDRDGSEIDAAALLEVGELR